MENMISIILAYLIGSLSCSIILAKITKQADPRSQGSGNAGATNVLRTQGRKNAIIVLLGDVLKGVIAVWMGRLLNLSPVTLGFIALAAVIGHIFPLYFNFKGGKGVATSFGVICALSLWSGIIALTAWLLTAFLSRYASLASLVAAVAALLATLLLGHGHQAFAIFMITLLVFYKHSGNIERLRKGTESKINL